MHKTAIGLSRKEIAGRVEKEQKAVHDYNSYVSIGNSVKKLEDWKKQGAEICQEPPVIHTHFVRRFGQCPNDWWNVLVVY